MSRDVIDVKIIRARYSLNGRRRYSTGSRKPTRKCYTASILVLIQDFFVKILIEMNANISN